MYKHRFKKYSNDEFKNFHLKNSHCDPDIYNVISGCFDILHQMVSDTALEPLNRIRAIKTILEFIYFEKDFLEKAFDGCFEALVEFTNNSIDSEVLLEASILLFNLIIEVLAKASMLVFNNAKSYEKISKKCIQNIIQIIKNENEKMDTRVKAIKFILYSGKKLDGFSNEESLPNAVCCALADIVLSGKFYSEGYLAALRLYFDGIYRHEEPPPEVAKQIHPIKLSRNDPCFCGSGKKYKKCCYEKNHGLDLYKIELCKKITDYNQVIKLEPNRAGTFYNRGNAKHLLGDNAQAIEDYDQAILLKPNDSDAFNNRGLCKKALGLYQEAVKDFDQSIALDPNNLRAFSNRGGVQYDLGHYELAMKDFNYVLKLNPNDMKLLQARKITEFIVNTQSMMQRN